MKENTAYRSDPYAAAAKAVAAAETCIRYFRGALVVCITTCATTSVIFGVLSFHEHAQLEDARSEVTRLRSTIDAMNPSNLPSAKESFDEIAARWAKEPCEKSNGGGVMLNGISTGDEVCRINRMEHNLARVFADCQRPDGSWACHQVNQ